MFLETSESLCHDCAKNLAVEGVLPFEQKKILLVSCDLLFWRWEQKQDVFGTLWISLSRLRKKLGRRRRSSLWGFFFCCRICVWGKLFGSSQLNPNFRSLTVSIQINRESEQAKKPFQKWKPLPHQKRCCGRLDGQCQQEASPVETDIRFGWNRLPQLCSKVA